MAKKVRSRIISFIPIALIILTYVALFLFLRNKLLFTPDFGESDAYHLNLSLKYYLAQCLKYNQLPFWTDRLQGGFPLLAEGQIGALFLPNILFLKFLPFVDGYNFLLIFALFCLTGGFYLLLKEFKINSILGLLFSFIFTFSGAISLHWTHLNLLQSFSLAPFLYLFLIRYFKTGEKRYLLLFPIVLQQMIFAGHSQTVFIGLLGISLSFVFYAINNKKNIIRNFLVYVFMIISGFVLALPQILPTLELAAQSSRGIVLNYDWATSYPLTWNHLISFILPFQFGNPKFGTYPPFSSNWGIFWENTPYLGIPLFILLIVGLIYYFRQHKKNLGILPLISITIILLLLALGKNSPLYFIFGIFPFNLFRTPSKYLLMVNFFLVLITALLTMKIFNHAKRFFFKFFIIITLLANIYLLVGFTFNYHLFISDKTVLQKPYLTLNDKSYYLTIGQGKHWNEVLGKGGWSSNKNIDKFIFFKNFFYPNSNLIFNKNSFEINTGGFRLRRIDYLNSFIQDYFKVANDKIVIDGKLIQLMKLLDIGNIISSAKISSDFFKPKQQLNRNDLEINLYEDSVRASAYYIPNEITNLDYLGDFEKAYDENKLNQNTALVEDLPDTGFKQNPGIDKLDLSLNTDSLIKFDSEGAEKTYIVIRRNWYPQWQVLIDGKKTAIYKTNLVHIGFFLPAGKHRVRIEYRDNRFFAGTVISLVYFTGLCFSLKFFKIDTIFFI